MSNFRIRKHTFDDNWEDVCRPYSWSGYPASERSYLGLSEFLDDESVCSESDEECDEDRNDDDVTEDEDQE